MTDIETLAKRTAHLEVSIAEVVKLQEANTRNVKELTEATKGIVEAWTVANGLAKFIKWVSSFTVIGACIVWLKDFIS